jgi:hypothetical protein
LHWDIAPWGHPTTGYYVYLEGTQEADVSRSPWPIGGMDCGSAFTLGVKAHDGSGDVSELYTSTYATPACVALSVPVDSVAPVDTAAGSVGSVYTSSTGSWTGGGISYAYQWQRCNWGGDGCVNITSGSGCTATAYTCSSSYTAVTADEGDRLQALVEASNSGGTTVSLPASETQAVAASAYRTFYISWTNGSDSNSVAAAQSKSTPWKTAPGMNGSSHSGYSYTAGDHYIFEGGDSWPKSTLPITAPGSGTATASTLYGVDPSWYIGASWTQPTLDEGTNPGSGAGPDYFTASPSYVEVDGLHLTDYYNNNVQLTGPEALVSTTNQDSITNTTLDGWHHDATCPSANAAVGWCDAYFLTYIGSGSVLLQGDTVDDSVGGSSCAAHVSSNSCSGGFVYQNGGTMVYDRNQCFEVVNCIEPGDTQNTIINSAFYDIGTSYDDSGGQGQHCNAIETDGIEYIGNNVFHDISNGCFTVEWNTGSVVDAWNNVVWNPGKSPFEAYNASTGSTLNAWNNTVVSYDGTGSDGACFDWNAGATGTGNLRNNHCVATSLNSGGTINSTTNLTQTVAQANSDSYAIGNSWAPTSAASPTVDAGTNYTASCTGAVTELCTSLDNHLRPTGSTAWDIGAYEWVP